MNNAYNYSYIHLKIDHVESVHVLKKSSENHSDPKNSIENSIIDQSESEKIQSPKVKKKFRSKDNKLLL